MTDKTPTLDDLETLISPIYAKMQDMIPRHTEVLEKYKLKVNKLISQGYIHEVQNETEEKLEKIKELEAIKKELNVLKSKIPKKNHHILDSKFEKQKSLINELLQGYSEHMNMVNDIILSKQAKDIRESEARVEEAKGGLEQAKAGLAQAKSVVEQAKTRVEQAKAGVEHAKAGVNETKPQAGVEQTKIGIKHPEVEEANEMVEHPKAGVEQVSSTSLDRFPRTISEFEKYKHEFTKYEALNEYVDDDFLYEVMKELEEYEKDPKRQEMDHEGQLGGSSYSGYETEADNTASKMKSEASVAMVHNLNEEL